MDKLLNEFAVDRRTVVKGLSAASASLVMATLGGCEPLLDAIRDRPVRRRLRTGSSQVDTAISSYRTAVSQMKALPATDPRSWRRQADLHGVASGFTFCQHGTPHFFSWHRAYLAYFERICRRMSGDAEFGLPYWNWNRNPDIHPAFLDSTSSLFNGRVRSSLAGFSQFSDATLTTILGDPNFITYSGQLEGTPHNSAHVLIGGDLAQFWSPRDPLFWPHHCMVDYCWAKWNLELGNDNPSDPNWQNTNWGHFVDEDGNGVTIDALTTVLMPLLSYQYEPSQIGSFRTRPGRMNQREFREVEDRLRRGAEVRFNIRETVRLSGPRTINTGRTERFDAPGAASRLGQLIGRDNNAERVFARVTYAELPPTDDFFVRLFLNAPGANAETPTSDPHFAGSYAFFGAGGHGTHDDEHGRLEFLVNISPVLERLARRDVINNSSDITLDMVAVPASPDGRIEPTNVALRKVELLVSPLEIRARE